MVCRESNSAFSRCRQRPGSNSASGAISSRRSRSGGSDSRRVLMRSYRSCRKRHSAIMSSSGWWVAAITRTRLAGLMAIVGPGRAAGARVGGQGAGAIQTGWRMVAANFTTFVRGVVDRFPNRFEAVDRRLVRGTRHLQPGLRWRRRRARPAAGSAIAPRPATPPVRRASAKTGLPPAHATPPNRRAIRKAEPLSSPGSMPARAGPTSARRSRG